MAYGIANRTGRPDDTEVGRMIQLASHAGISLVDTAHAYGESESVIGRVVPVGSAFRVVTKTATVSNGTISEQDLGDICAAFEQSLNRLGRAKIYGLMVHSAQDLLRPGAERIWGWMEALRAEAIVERIGVSLYDPDQYFRLRERFNPTLVQIPLNIYDRRFISSGALRDMAEAGVEVHARSAFLQGLLLMPPQSLPAEFSALRTHHARLHRWIADARLDPLTACLAFSLAQTNVHRVIVGCERECQLTEILVAAALAGSTLEIPADLALVDDRVINPSRWAART
jgi:aryl-alcohol dehydrogenase-like predicted oxidoreductase